MQQVTIVPSFPHPKIDRKPEKLYTSSELRDETVIASSGAIKKYQIQRHWWRCQKYPLKTSSKNCQLKIRPAIFF
jgi:hypothetical protein